MVKFKIFSAVIVFVLLPLTHFSVAHAHSTTYSYTGGQQTYTVPAGVTSLVFDLAGAEGYAGKNGSGNVIGAGGKGGRTQATLTVTPGETLYIYVGGAGTGVNTGGYNGGGYGYAIPAWGTYPGRGGGGTDVRRGGTALANRILVAGGGGGGGNEAGSPTPAGGSGGGTTGESGFGGDCPGCPGTGGTQSAGGVGGYMGGYGTGSPGTLGVGGGTARGDATYNDLGGGGGGGYYGGGCGVWGGGGGGSSYVTTSGSSGVTHTQQYRSGNGQVIISIPHPSALIQGAYKWFENSDSTGVGRGSIMNTPITAPAQGTPFRLRLLLHVNGSDIAVSATSSLLQYAVRSGTCDTGFSGESYSTLSSSSGDIRFYNNATPADGAALTANYGDPKHASTSNAVLGYDTVRNQTYNETGTYFSNSQAGIAVGEDGMWDFSLVDYSAPSGTTYCFRAVQAGGGVLSGGYSVIPQITTFQSMKIKLRSNVKLRQVKFR